jgi:hypothetical protein
MIDCPDHLNGWKRTRKQSVRPKTTRFKWIRFPHFLCATRTTARPSTQMSKPGSSSSRPSTSATTPNEKPPDSRVSRTPKSVRAVWEFIRPQPWVINNLRQRKSQINLFRSCLASWAALVLMLPHHSLATIGNLCVQSTFRPLCSFALTESIHVHAQCLFRHAILCVHPSWLSGANVPTCM